METMRIDGIKYNPNRLSDEEVVNMREHLTNRAIGVFEDIVAVEGLMLARGLEVPELMIPMLEEEPAEELLDHQQSLW